MLSIDVMEFDISKHQKIRLARQNKYNFFIRGEHIIEVGRMVVDKENNKLIIMHSNVVSANKFTTEEKVREFIENNLEHILLENMIED